MKKRDSIFEIFTPLRVGGPPTPQNILVREPGLLTCEAAFKKQRNLHVFGQKRVQNIGFYSVFNVIASQTLETIAIYRVFSCLSVFLRAWKAPKTNPNSNSRPS